MEKGKVEAMVILKSWEKYDGGWHGACQALFGLPFDGANEIAEVRAEYNDRFRSRVYFCAAYYNTVCHYWRYMLGSPSWYGSKEVSWHTFGSLEECKVAADKALAETNEYYIMKSNDEFEKIVLLG